MGLKLGNEWAPAPFSVGEKVSTIINNDSLTTAGKCAAIAFVYSDREKEESNKRFCIEQASRGDAEKPMKLAKEMYDWIIE